MVKRVGLDKLAVAYLGPNLYTLQSPFLIIVIFGDPEHLIPEE
jgi:hypothetical protein